MMIEHRTLMVPDFHTSNDFAVVECISVPEQAVTHEPSIPIEKALVSKLNDDPRCSCAKTACSYLLTDKFVRI
ncbi:unnamed protein product [Knipowitschia caucasica]